MAVTVNMHEAKTQLSRLVARAANGEEIILAKAGKPKARIVRVKDPEADADFRKPGWGRDLLKGINVDALFDPALNKGIEDLLYGGPLFPDK